MSRKLAITARAAQEVRRAAAASGAEGMALRVAAKREDDGSVMLGIGFDAERTNDELIETAGVTLLVSHHSRDLLEDMVLDFVEPDFVVRPAPPGEDEA
jgi:Fe-S cluster assembly iron-binding protein IscA